jgi:peptidoglycan/LPS O-acetylase OafA/YrhL
MRLALATLVVFGHFCNLQGMPAPKYSLYDYADLAVDAFFIISGYLVSASFDKRPVLVDFFLKRFFRIYPLYLVLIVAQAIVMVGLLGGLQGHSAQAVRYLAANGVFANFLQYDIGGVFAGLPSPGINPSLWTLKIEIGFYLVLPWLWIAIRRFGFALPIALYALSTVFIMFHAGGSDTGLARQLPGQFRFFVVGTVLYRYGDRIRIGPMSAIVLAVALAILCAMRHDLPLQAVYPMLLGLLVFLLALRMPALPMSRDISFGVYLFHGPVMQIALRQGWFRNDPAFLLAVTAATFALAMLANFVIERPGIDLGHRLAQQRPQRHMDILA